MLDCRSHERPRNAGGHPAVLEGTRQRPIVMRWSLLATLLASMLIAVSSVGTFAATPRTYYVDCSGGNDAYAGTATTTAWRSLVKANGATLAPGDSLLLRRGCTWTGPLKVKWVGTVIQPIRIGAYGSGELPKIQNHYDNVDITGSHLIIENLFARADAPTYDSGCQNARAGWRVGFRFRSGAAYNTLRYSRADDLYAGAFLSSGSHHNRVMYNRFSNNNMKSADVASDAGAIGIDIAGDDNEIAYNAISGSDACSRWFGGRDGSAISIFGGQRNSIHHNDAWENNNFIEFGHSRSSDTIVAYNKVGSTLKIATFLVTRGASDYYGPVARTRAYNNTAYLTGSSAYAIQCGGGCGPGILTFKNNVVWSEDRIGYADAAFDESNNIYWKSNGAPKIYFPISSTSRRANPSFVNVRTWDFRLAAGSPGIDAGTIESVNRGFTRDFGGDAVPLGAGVDIGMDEYRD